MCLEKGWRKTQSLVCCMNGYFVSWLKTVDPFFYLWAVDGHRYRKETGNSPQSWLITATFRDLGHRMTLAAMRCCCFSPPRPTLLWQACFIFNLKSFARITAAFKQVHPSQEGGERWRKVQAKEKGEEMNNEHMLMALLEWYQLLIFLPPSLKKDRVKKERLS